MEKSDLKLINTNLLDKYQLLYPSIQTEIHKFNMKIRFEYVKSKICEPRLELRLLYSIGNVRFIWINILLIGDTYIQFEVHILIREFIDSF